MEIKTSYFWILAIAIAVVSLLVGVFVFGGSSEINDEELNSLVNVKAQDLVNQLKLEAGDVIKTLQDEKADLQSQLDNLKTNMENMGVNVTTCDPTQPSGPDNPCPTLPPQTPPVTPPETQDPVSGYVLDDVFLDEDFDDVLSDREVSLYDDEVTFDEDEYDVEELFSVEGLVAINEEDFKENAYLTFEEDDLFYKVILDTSLDLEDIDEDETLKLFFLGSEIEISEWDTSSNEITFTKGTEYNLDDGETISVDGNSIVLSMVLEDSVYVLVNGEGEKIYEGDTEKVNGVEIKVKEVLYSPKSSQTSMAVLQIGSEVEEVVQDGDEFEEDSIWEYRIENHSIGIVLVEDFLELDDREDYNALDVGDSLCLPSNYLCVFFDGLTEEDEEEYNFELDNGVVVVEGSFVAGIKDFDEIFLNDSKIYEDDDCTEEITEDVYFGDSDVELTLNSTTIVIGDIELSVDLDAMTVDGVDVSGKEDNYRTKYGIVIKEPEDALEDQEVKLTVPEEELEGLLRVL